MSGNYQDLLVWQKAMDMVLKVYEVTKSFPRDEVYGLVSQMRRAAISVPSNIAEGKGRRSRKELAQFLFHARGSLLELETQNQIAERAGVSRPAPRSRTQNSFVRSRATPERNDLALYELSDGRR